MRLDGDHCVFRWGGLAIIIWVLIFLFWRLCFRVWVGVCVCVFLYVSVCLCLCVCMYVFNHSSDKKRDRKTALIVIQITAHSHPWHGYWAFGNKLIYFQTFVQSSLRALTEYKFLTWWHIFFSHFYFIFVLSFLSTVELENITGYCIGGPLIIPISQLGYFPILFRGMDDQHRDGE